jgi:hypothetical protein
MLKKISLMALSAISAFAMHTAEININDTDLELGAKFDIGQFNDNVEPNTMFVGLKLLEVDNQNRYNNTPLYEFSFLMTRPVGKNGLHFGMGVKLNYTQDFSSLPLGLEAGYTFPTKDLVPMSINGSVYYGPKVLSFNSAERYLEYRANYDIEIIENGRITVGYRSIHTDYNDIRENYRYNESVYFGFKFLF